nr:adenosylcobinamide-phosphate synthase CbiB [Rhodoferax sp.]
MSALALLVALTLDRWWGEPRAWLHPVVWMGRYLGWAGRRVAPLANAEPQTQPGAHSPVTTNPEFKHFLLGALAWLVGAAIVSIAAWALQKGVMALPDWLGQIPGGLLAVLLLGLFLKPMLAWAMLRSEVLAVENALSPEQGGSLGACRALGIESENRPQRGQFVPDLQGHSSTMGQKDGAKWAAAVDSQPMLPKSDRFLAAGRERLSWLVSRDVTHLSETQVRESAIESLAENLNDSVVAPIFWFVLLGLPGAALYRFANTADAMWGYHGVRNGQNWEWAGKWAARADDVLSWLPARITALLLWGIGGGTGSGRGLRGGWTALRTEAARTPSPNSGWPMAAMALALDVCLHKPGVYALNTTGHPPQAQDTQQALAYASKVLIALVFIAPLAIILVAFGRAPWL